jgi:D-inositol-3-phosphate glycosyltransferase
VISLNVSAISAMSLHSLAAATKKTLHKAAIRKTFKYASAIGCHMKVLFVIENYIPHIGGVEVVFKNLAEGLVKKGHSATIITHRLKGTLAYEKINGVNVKRISCGNRYFFTFFSIPATVAEAGKADIIHTTTFNGFFPAWVAAKLKRKPLVATIHEVWLGKWKEYTDLSTVSSWLHNLFESMIYSLPKIDRYVAVSNSTKQQLNRIGKKNVTVVYNGVDYSHFNPAKAKGSGIRQRYHLNKNYVFLVYGRPGPSKGIEYAIAAMPKIICKIPNAKMMLILSRDKQYESKYGKMLQLIKKLGLRQAIITIPPVSHSELPDYLKAADCVIVPSLSEGFGYAAAEAAAMGTPIIASNTTSLPEVVSGKYVLVEPKNPEAIAEAAIKQKKGKIKPKPLKKFLIENNINGYLNVYKELR